MLQLVAVIVQGDILILQIILLNFEDSIFFFKLHFTESETTMLNKRV